MATSETSMDHSKDFKATITSTLAKIPPVVWILLVMITIFSIQSEDYLEWSNLRNILVQAVSLMLVALAQTLVILTEGVDLSLGAQVSLATVLWVLFMQFGMPWYIAAILTIASLMFAGVINGLIVSKGKIPPFIATLGMQGVLYSIALLITKGASSYHRNDIFQVISETIILGIPLIVWITGFLFLLTWIVLYRTKLGIQIFGLGGNPEALSLAGINITKPTVMVFAYAAFLASMSGLLTTCRLESGQPIVGQGWEFEAVAATIIGGTSFREGKGGIVGTIFGVLLITILKNGLNILHVFSTYQNFLIGTIILLTIIADITLRRFVYRNGNQ